MNEKKYVRPVLVENAKLIYRNFAGNPDEYHRDGGARSFCVILPEDLADQMANEGWNVKQTRPKSEDFDPVPYIQVKVAFNNYPPKIIQVSGGRTTPLGAEDVGHLDWADIESADVLITPYTWDDNGIFRISAYLKTLAVVLCDDPILQKYSSTNAEFERP